MGLLGFASLEIGILPDRKAFLPALTPSLKASPIVLGSFAPAIAVFTSTASAPDSITRDASDGTPSPASTTTGTPDCSIIICISSRARTPLPDQIGDPRGITVEQPTSSNLLAKTGSGEI